MKAIMRTLVFGLFIISSIQCNADAAADKTKMDQNWKCTTNASSSNVQTEQAADKTMNEKMRSAAQAFKFAMHHCRNCTKITCEFTKP